MDRVIRPLNNRHHVVHQPRSPLHSFYWLITFLQNPIFVVLFFVVYVFCKVCFLHVCPSGVYSSSINKLQNMLPVIQALFIYLFYFLRFSDERGARVTRDGRIVIFFVPLPSRVIRAPRLPPLA